MVYLHLTTIVRVSLIEVPSSTRLLHYNQRFQNMRQKFVWDQAITILNSIYLEAIIEVRFR